MLQNLIGRVDFLLALCTCHFSEKQTCTERYRKEDEDVATRLGNVDLQDRDNACVQIVRLGGLGVVDVDGIPSSWDCCKAQIIKEPFQI